MCEFENVMMELISKAELIFIFKSSNYLIKIEVPFCLIRLPESPSVYSSIHT